MIRRPRPLPWPALTGAILMIFNALAVTTARADNSPARYDVVWATPSEDAGGSMPLGNGDIGLNVWATKAGEIVFYLSKTDAWSENARLLKLGRVRIALSPNPFDEGGRFEQALRLASGEVVIRGARDGRPVEVRVWVDANHPVVHVQGRSETPLRAQVDLELWRTERRALSQVEIHSAYGLKGGEDSPVYVEPDTVVDSDRPRLTWYHRNERSIWADNLRLQALGDLVSKQDDPLLHWTFGAAIEGDGFERASKTSLRTKEAINTFDVSVHVLATRTDTAKQWLDELDTQVRRVSARDVDRAYREHRAWWEAFWDRSWIHVRGDERALDVSRGYALQRFINACAGRGGSPIKFNGSIFNVDLVAPIRNIPAGLDADFRAWGGPYWWQNTRLPYWSMLAAGDLDFMQPLFRMYREALPLARKRTERYYGHGGALFPETMYFWGTYTNTNYGLDRSNLPDGLTQNRYIRYEWQGGIELTMMMLDYYDITDESSFLEETLLPIADAVMTFYDEHYERDDEGKIHIWPAQALETWWDVPNPMPEIAGLHAVLPRLLNLPDAHTSEAQRARWRRMLGELPALPTREVDGQAILAAADKLENKHNSEDPELYAVFPYRLFGVGRDGLEQGRQTYEHRMHKGTGGWRQDAIWAAMLGLGDEAADMVTANFTTKNPTSRFPAFWGPNYDWVPDQDHGGVAMIALQHMILQTQGDRILLMPAWPKEWDVRFKLRAPGNTVIEGAYEDAAMRSLTVTPPRRRADVVVGDQ